MSDMRHPWGYTASPTEVCTRIMFLYSLPISDRSGINDPGAVMAIESMLSNVLASYVMKGSIDGVKLRRIFSMFTDIHNVTIHNKDGFVKHLHEDLDTNENKYLSEILLARSEDEEGMEVAGTSKCVRRA